MHRPRDRGSLRRHPPRNGGWVIATRHLSLFANHRYTGLMPNARDATLVLDPKYDAAGLVTAVVTDRASGALLMVAHMNAEALAATQATGKAHFWSRSRGRLWRKGETSGNVLTVVELRIDCDQDALWVIAEPAGPACHTGADSCFYRRIEGDTLVPIA